LKCTTGGWRATYTAAKNIVEGKLTTANRSGIRGVFQDAKTRKWRASGSDKGRTVFLGNYDTKEEAIKARQRFVNKKYGDIMDEIENGVSNED